MVGNSNRSRWIFTFFLLCLTMQSIISFRIPTLAMNRRIFPVNQRSSVVISKYTQLYVKGQSKPTGPAKTSSKPKPTKRKPGPAKSFKKVSTYVSAKRKPPDYKFNKFETEDHSLPGDPFKPRDTKNLVEFGVVQFNDDDDPLEAKVYPSDGKVDNRACFGAGNFWGTERFFKNKFHKVFGNSSLITPGRVGFMGRPGLPPDPDWFTVSWGGTEYVGVYDFTFDGTAETYRKLVQFFFMFHDPTALHYQGNDYGTQFSSTIFAYDDFQRTIAHEVRDELINTVANNLTFDYRTREVVTTIKKADIFYPAPEGHQGYLDKYPGAYCNHRFRYQCWPPAPPPDEWPVLLDRPPPTKRERWKARLRSIWPSIAHVLSVVMDDREGLAIHPSGRGVEEPGWRPV